MAISTNRSFLTSARVQRLESRLWSPNARRVLFVAALSCASIPSAADAQSWSSERVRPQLRQIVSVDETGEGIWPYGREDVAGDGFSKFAADEAGTDVRSVYADADDDRLWLRAYVASEDKPSENLITFFFADTDDRDDTGGPAFGESDWPFFTRDESQGGYERAVGVRGDGTLVGAWTWEKGPRTWTELSTRMDDVRIELGRDEDPIRIGPVTHGYVQIDVRHALSGLNRSCAGNLFVRTWNDEAAPRAFGDDDAEIFECRPAVDVYGDPVVIRSARCGADRDCPNDGRCRDGVCLFAYPCARDADCRSDERCTLDACIRVVEERCDSNADCNGLVCRDGACGACSDSGALACDEGLSCGPNGACVDTGDYVPPAGGGDGGVNADAGLVRGGAFRCATYAPTKESSVGAWLLVLFGALFIRRRENSKGRA